MQLCTFSAFPAVPQRALCCTSTGATGAASGPAVTPSAAGSAREAGPGRAAKDVCAGALQKQGREEERVPVAAAHVTPLDNSRLEDPGFFDISSEFSLTIFKDSQMPKSCHRKLIKSEEKTQTGIS